MTPNRDALFADPKSCVYRLVRKKARELLRTPGFHRSDLEDLEQEFLLELWERLEAYDPEQADLVTFLGCTLNRKACKLIRDRKAPVRDFQREECSLDELIPMGEEGLAPRSEIFAEEARYAHTQTDRISDLEHIELTMDLETVLSSLSDDLKELCKLLATSTVKDIAELQGRTRRQVSQDVARLREIFAAAGLDDYFKRRPSLPRRA